jgi:group I intron endonuclease
MKSGIYKISNTINGRIYIGSAVDLQKRKAKHLFQLKINKHCNNKLQRFVNKYGIENLLFECIELCEKENLIKREQYFIDFFGCVKNGFNILQTAGSWLNHKHTKETRKKQSIAKKGIQSKGMLGKKHTDETKNLIAKKAFGRKQTEKQIQNRIKKNTGKKRPISAILTVRKKLEILNREQVLEIRELLKTGMKQIDIAKKFNVCQGVISRVNIGKAYYDVF